MGAADLAGVWRQIRSACWLRAAAIALAVGATGFAIWLFGTRYFSHELPPEFAQYSERLAEPVPLADIFDSGAAVAAVAAGLTARGYRPDHTSSGKPPSRRYPPRDLDTLEVSGYRHLDQEGRLTLEFFNDRLYEARFAPEDVRRYVARIHAAEPALQRDHIGMAELVRGAQRIAANVDLANNKVGRALATRPYVLWQDLRLKRQLAQWEAQYGAESSRPEK